MRAVSKSVVYAEDKKSNNPKDTSSAEYKLRKSRYPEIRNKNEIPTDSTAQRKR